MTAPVLTTEEQTLLASMLAHKVRFMIVGLTSAVLQGAHVVTQDIDLWVEKLDGEAFVKAIDKAGGFYIPPAVAGMNPPMLGPNTLRIFDLVTHMHGLDEFSVEYSRAKEIELAGLSLKLLPLERIIASKEAAAREKDKAVLPILRAALALTKETEKQRK